MKKELWDRRNYIGKDTAVGARTVHEHGQDFQGRESGLESEHRHDDAAGMAWR